MESIRLQCCYAKRNGWDKLEQTLDNLKITTGSGNVQLVRASLQAQYYSQGDVWQQSYFLANRQDEQFYSLLRTQNFSLYVRIAFLLIPLCNKINVINLFILRKNKRNFTYLSSLLHTHAGSRIDEMRCNVSKQRNTTFYNSVVWIQTF